MSRRWRTKTDGESEPVAKAAQGHLAEAGPDGMQIPERYSYVAEDRLHGKITALIGEKVDYLYQKAVENPNSEANAIVRILLLNQIRHMQPEKYQEEPRLTLTEERRRGIEVEQKQEMYQHEAKKFEIFAAVKALEIERLSAQVKKLEAETERTRLQLDQARRVLDQAKTATEYGQPMDPQQVYQRIFEIVGLNSPLEPIGEPSGAAG